MNEADASYFEADSWVTVGIFYDQSAGTIKSYKDGVLFDTYTGITALSLDGTVHFGSSVGSNDWDGDIAGVWLFNYDTEANALAWSTAIADGTFHLPATDKGADNANLFTNGTMETGGTVDVSLPSNWTNYSTPTSAFKANTASNSGTGKVYAGTYSAYVDAADGVGIRNNGTADVVNGETYIISAWVYPVSGTVNMRRENPTVLDFSEVSVGTGAWEMLTETVTAGSSGTVDIKFVASGGAAEFYVDNLSIIQLGSTLTLTPEGMYSTAWRDFDHDALYSVSGPSLVVDSYHNAYKFNGTDSYASVPDANIDVTGDMTVIVRFRFTGIAANQFICSDGSLDLFENYNAGSERLGFSRDGSTTIYSGTIAPDTDYHLAVTSTAAGVTNFYINGVLSGSANQAAGTPTDGGVLYFGTDSDGAASPFNGVMGGKPRFYNTILSTSDITLDYDTYK